MSPAILKSFTNTVVDLTMDYARTLVEKTPDCIRLPFDHKRTAVDLTLIIDGSRTAYENLQLIHSISEMIDVSSFGSSISIIHGSTGQFLANRTNSVANLFEQLRNSTLKGSKSMRLITDILMTRFTYFRSNSSITFQFIWQFNVPIGQSNNKRKRNRRLRCFAKSLPRSLAISSNH